MIQQLYFLVFTQRSQKCRPTQNPENTYSRFVCSCQTVEVEKDARINKLSYTLQETATSAMERSELSSHAMRNQTQKRLAQVENPM